MVGTIEFNGALKEIKISLNAQLHVCVWQTIRKSVIDSPILDSCSVATVLHVQKVRLQVQTVSNDKNLAILTLVDKPFKLLKSWQN